MNAMNFLQAAFAGRRLATLGFLWLVMIAVAAIAAPLIAPFDPLEIDPVGRLAKPGWPNLFGTDHFGRDTFSRAVYGARMTVIIGTGSVVVALLAGGLIGMVSAYFTKLGHFLMRGVDVLMAFPALLMALVLITLLERSVFKHDPRDWYCLRHNHRPHPLRHDIKVEGRSVRRCRCLLWRWEPFHSLSSHSTQPRLTFAGASKLHICLCSVAGCCS